MIEMFDDQLLEKFIYKFYGYGNYKGPYWFIGMEEGGGNSFGKIVNRLNAWQKRGKRELEDLVEYNKEIDPDCRWFNNHAKLQPTWKGLIRILLNSKGISPQFDKEKVRKYQRESWGRLKGENYLVDLLPLPSRSIKDWFYAQHSRLPYLENREKYEQTLLSYRIKGLKQRISKYKPKVVIFYGLKYREHWKSIAEIDFSEPHGNGISTGRDGSTLFVITKHPVTRGIKNEYFHQVGKIIQSMMK